MPIDPNAGWHPLRLRVDRQTQGNEKAPPVKPRGTLLYLDATNTFDFTSWEKDQDCIKKPRSGIGDVYPVARRMLTSGNEFILNGVRRRTRSFKECSPIGIAGKNGEAESVWREHLARGADLEIPASVRAAGLAPLSITLPL
jgi:hypothetical protein